jgi:hypothetical protein
LRDAEILQIFYSRVVRHRKLVTFPHCRKRLRFVPKQPSAEEVGRLDRFLYEAAQNFKIKIKNKKPIAVSFSRSIQWYYSHADLIWRAIFYEIYGDVCDCNKHRYIFTYSLKGTQD